MRRAALVLALAILPARAATAAEPAKEEPSAAAPAAPTYVDEATCAACHQEQADRLAKTPHGALLDEKRPEGVRGCQACHGPGSAHVEAGGGKGVGGLRVDARTQPARERAAVCLGCHAGSPGLHDFRGGEHGLSAVACTDCHAVHAAHADHLLRKAAPELCYGCHLEVRAKFALPEHHRVNEGVLGCADCHQPHGSRTPHLMRAANDRTCFRCHAEVEGPFVFEHAGNVTEGCMRCHDPHGSVNRHLLIRQQVAQLCYECHTVTPSNHLQPSYRDCTRCHVDIHGSNIDPRFLEQ